MTILCFYAVLKYKDLSLTTFTHFYNLFDQRIRINRIYITK